MHCASQFTKVVPHVPLIELSISEEDLDIAVLEFPAIETGFHNLIRRAEEDSLALRAVFAPLSLEDNPVGELTDSCAMPQVVLPEALIDVTIRQNHLALATFLSFRNTAIIDITRHLAQLIIGLGKKLIPVNRYYLRQELREFQIRLFPAGCLDS